MKYVFLMMALISILIIFGELFNTIFGKVIFGVIFIILLIKFIKFIKRDGKDLFRITKKSVIYSILVILSTLFINEVMLVSFSSIIHKIVYLLCLGIVIYFQRNQSYSHKESVEREIYSDENIAKMAMKANKNGVYDNWEEKKEEIFGRAQELQKDIDDFINSDDEEFKLNWVNSHCKYIKINSNSKGNINYITDIKDEKLRLKIVEYTKDKLYVDKINYGTLKRINGSKDKININLPIKIVSVYYDVFVGNFIYRRMVLEEEDSRYGKPFNVIGYEEDILDRKVVIIKNDSIVENIKKIDEKIGTFEIKYGNIKFFDKDSYVDIDYRY